MRSAAAVAGRARTTPSAGVVVRSVSTHQRSASRRRRVTACPVAKLTPAARVRMLSVEQIAARLISDEDKFAWNGMPTRAWQNNQKGAKLEFMKPDEGIVLLPQNMFILEGAPHPNAGKLLVDFLVSKEGQQMFREADYIPVDPTIPPRDASLRPDSGGFSAIYFTPEQVAGSMPGWMKILKDLFG